MALPPSLESHLHAAEVHNAEQRWREAAVEWREALRFGARKARHARGIGEALFRSRDYEAAMATLKPLLSSDSAEAQFLYGASLLNLQQPMEAMPYLRQAIARDARLLAGTRRAGPGIAADRQGRGSDPSAGERNFRR